MFETSYQPRDIFEEGCRSVQHTLLAFGVGLVTLAVLIFAYPALIGFIAAAFILLAGIAALYWGYQFYRFKKHLSKVEKESRPLAATFRTQGPYYTRRAFTFVIR